MIAALIIVFREMIEAGLIIGIALAVTRQIPHGKRWIAGGVAVGILGSSILAVFTGTIAATFEGMGQELFNAAIMAVAVVMLGWHNIWMARHGRELAREIMSAGDAVAAGSRSVAALAVVVGVAVLREGAEVVLFLYSIIAGGESPMALAIGGASGLLLGAALTAVTYLGLVQIPSRYLFATTGLLIAFLAAGLAAQSALFLERAGVVTVFDTIMWDSSWLLSESSVTGSILHTLIGYMEQPTGAELLAYLVTLVTILTLSRILNPRRMPQKATAA